MNTELNNKNDLKYECIQFWKEFILWILVAIVVGIVATLICIVIYCFVNFV